MAHGGWPFPGSAEREPSTSTGMAALSRTSSDTRVLWKGTGNQVRRLSNPWLDERESHRLRTNTPEPVSDKAVDTALHRLRRARREMTDGIDEMQCQIYQIRFCDNILKQERKEKQLVSKTLMDRQSPPPSSKPPSERIPIARDLFYESSWSGMDHSPDYCFRPQKPYGSDTDAFSVSPIHTPVLMECSDSVINSIQDSSINKRCEVTGLPIPEISAFQINASDMSTTDVSVSGGQQSNGESVSEEKTEAASPCGRTVLSRRMKTDVVLNLQNQRFSRETSSGSPVKAASTVQCTAKPKTLDKFIGLFYKRKMKFRSRSVPATRGNLGKKWSPQKSAVGRTAKQNDFSCGKFSDKYPVDSEPDGQREMFGGFCMTHKGRSIEAESESIVYSMPGTKRNYVISADGIANGIACFDVTCLHISAWCFVGVVERQAAISSQCPVSEAGNAYGWSNEGECFRGGVSHFVSNREPFGTSSNFQLAVNAEAGTVHFRFPSQRRPGRQDFVEHEISALPKNTEWCLAIEWDGEGRFELNSIQVWQ